MIVDAMLQVDGTPNIEEKEELATCCITLWLFCTDMNTMCVEIFANHRPVPIPRYPTV